MEKRPVSKARYAGRALGHRPRWRRGRARSVNRPAARSRIDAPARSSTGTWYCRRLEINDNAVKLVLWPLAHFLMRIIGHFV